MKPFLTFTLVRFKRPQDFDPRNPFRSTEVDLGDLEHVNVRIRPEEIVCITATVPSMAPPGAKTLIGVKGIGEFLVAETPEEVRDAIAEGHDLV